ncbi:MAG: RNA polymerase Rpb4 family protein [Euryarchaeota archaeon]|nr:RNA polymerase Rpb4 family protein [Euryarchaeota archaeon]MBU4221202.1 RNA polymerase Rpb4 family protein [Euryarchaeota archaeon]MBU4340668.1 RNA polymerase Rpb4 family protein [Euryarchaeota archaeon]MBU4453911.1 RNA polymerase Rpb4 family protein [Euryarchaeota archaeon]MCG2735136.1 RNA polymerase Rpb4 family protein [Candidatus Methanoperedenaceae archaeon]
MIVKKVLQEEGLTLPEVKKILDHIKEERETEGKELGYELRKAISHAEIFSKISAKKSRELVNELLKLEKMKPEIAIRIADVLPLSNDEIRTIYAKERYTLSEDELKQILELVIKVE